MPNSLMKCLSCKVILLCLLLMVEGGTFTSQDNKGTKKLSSIAKRSFLSKELDYLKVKPISDDLKLFIKRFKRKSPTYFAKIKRQDEMKEHEHMFVVDNGNIVPLDNMSDVTSVPRADPSGLGNFTVIPLVIPITVKTFTNATFCHTSTEPNDEESQLTDSMRKTEKTMQETEETEKPPAIERVEEKQEQKPPPTTTSTTVANDISTTEVIVDNAISTKKSENMKFLNKVLSDVQDLISYEKEGKASGNNEGAQCTVIGDWDSNAGGMQLQISPRNESLNSPKVEITEQQPMAESGFLRTGKWNVTTEMPFNHSSLIILTAIAEQTVASFIGDCRICEGTETITGNWMLARRSTDCKDRQETHSFFSDVMRKSNIRRLQKAHLDELSTKVFVTTTEL